MKARQLVIASLSLMPALAMAHPGHDGGHGFMSGFMHPWSGMDHLITMLAVGMWAAQMGGRMRWALPLSFVSMMIVGALLGFGGIHLGAVEQSIAASVCVLGLLLFSAKRLPSIACVILTSCFAIFHGYAHAIEASNAGAIAYISGFTISTALLHALGISIAILLDRHQRVLRWAGALIAVSGVAMLLS
ncbi:MAG: HupE/UreJ family protein [Steroidobacter sp.]